MKRRSRLDHQPVSVAAASDPIDLRQHRPPPGVDGSRRRRWDPRRSAAQRGHYAQLRTARLGRRHFPGPDRDPPVAGGAHASSPIRSATSPCDTQDHFAGGRPDGSVERTSSRRRLPDPTSGDISTRSDPRRGPKTPAKNPSAHEQGWKPSLADFKASHGYGDLSNAETLQQFNEDFDRTKDVSTDHRPRAIAEVIARSKWLYGEAYKKVFGDRNARTNLAHEVVSRLAHNARRGKRFSPKENFAAYWSQAIANELVSINRQNTARWRAEDGKRNETPAQVDDDPAARLEAIERITQIKKRASQLPPRQREWLQLVESGISPAEANRQLAKKYGKSVRTLERDVKRLRAHFEDLRWRW